MHQTLHELQTPDKPLASHSVWLPGHNRPARSRSDDQASNARCGLQKSGTTFKSPPNRGEGVLWNSKYRFAPRRPVFSSRCLPLAKAPRSFAPATG